LLSEVATSVLSDYLTRIRRKDFIDSISSLESKKEFPFSLLNDLRGYINYAPFYFQAFADLLLHENFDREDPQRIIAILGFPTRMQRYALTLFVLGAHLNEHFAQSQKLAAIDKLVNLIILNQTTFSKLTEKIANEAMGRHRNNIDSSLDDDVKLKHVQLCIALREYVDFLFLGEHLIGCEIAKPITLDGITVVTRHFFNLDISYQTKTISNARLIQIYDQTDAPDLYNFRGRLDNIRGYKSIKFCYHEVDNLANPHESIDELISEIIKAMRGLRTKYQMQSEAHLELDKMRIYSVELARLHQYLKGEPYSIPDDVQKVVLDKKISSQKMLEYGKSDYSHLFFCLLTEGLESLLNFR
jgi:hypothetical protein